MPAAARDYLELLLKDSIRDGVEVVVGALIVNRDGRMFAQRRTTSRKMFPGCWDIAGGHVERGETLMEALAREVAEETGWHLKEIIGLVGVYEWQKEFGATSSVVREFEFLVSLQNEDSPPKLEDGKVDIFRWIAVDETEILLENRRRDDTFMRDIFDAGFRELSKRGFNLKPSSESRPPAARPRKKAASAKKAPANSRRPRTAST